MTQIELPPPSSKHPTVARVVSMPPSMALGTDEVVWQLGGTNPMNNFTIVRMFDEGEAGVVIYSVDKVSLSCARQRIPQFMLKFVEEGMRIDLFIRELEAAESDDEDPDEDEPEEDEPEEPEDTPAAGVQPPTT
jgi:hypothetical protein